ncbi:MAG: type II secretion system F family protein [Kiritimatiellae bacterium]|nr:type II secretion system F family protein [Kiritimatiellia bacterium]
MSEAASVATIVLWALCAVGLAWYVADVAKDVTYVTLADGRRQERSIPLLFRVLLPLAPNFFGLVRRPALQPTVARADAMLVQGGFEGLLTGEEFVALRLMLLWVVPDIWLRRAVARRHLSIQRSLPFVLDLLTLSVEAGMDFITALQRNCRARRPEPLDEELLRMTKEIQVGASRKDALRRMAERVRQPDLRSAAYALIQADELGVSIGAMLRIQSEQLRSRRFDRAERMAAQAPVKMLGPLMLCIFPAVFIILLGPVLAQAMKGLF